MPEARNEIIFIVIAGTFILLALAGFVIFFVAYYRLHRRKDLIEKQQMKMSFQQELMRTQLEIQEQTLKTISQEIHDNIGQSLSLAKLNLNTFDINRAEQAQSKVESTKELVAKAIQDLRDLSRSLNTDSILSSGLINAIEVQLILMEKSGAFKTQLSVTGRPIRFDMKKEVILFRIIQEAINNIIKHANCSKINITAAFTESDLSLTIQDDGSGFDINMESQGSGLRNMENRAHLIGAHYTIHSDAKGTTIKVVLPILEQ